MKSRVLRREAAKRDLIAHWVWYAENGSIEVADRFLEEVGRTLEILSSHPESGARVAVNRPDLQGIRRFPIGGKFGAVLLFYFGMDDGIELVRVLHGARDLDSILEEGRHG